MPFRVVGRPADGDVHGGAHADLVAGLDLLTEQVEFLDQMRVTAADLGREVAPAVVALGEKRDVVDPAQLQRFLETLFVESRTNLAHVLGGMEVEMDVAGGQGRDHAGMLAASD